MAKLQLSFPLFCLRVVGMNVGLYVRIVARGRALAPRHRSSSPMDTIWVIQMGGVVYLDQIGLPVCRFWPKFAAERLGNALAARMFGH